LIAQAGAIAPLVTLVQSGTEGQKENAAGALRSLSANNAENKVLIAQAGAIAPLVTLVQSGTAGQKEYVAGVLSNLAVNALGQRREQGLDRAGGWLTPKPPCHFGDRRSVVPPPPPTSACGGGGVCARRLFV
jgi:hypothetical protein